MLIQSNGPYYARFEAERNTNLRRPSAGLYIYGVSQGAILDLYGKNTNISPLEVLFRDNRLTMTDEPAPDSSLLHELLEILEMSGVMLSDTLIRQPR